MYTKRGGYLPFFRAAKSTTYLYQQKSFIFENTPGFRTPGLHCKSLMLNSTEGKLTKAPHTLLHLLLWKVFFNYLHILLLVSGFIVGHLMYCWSLCCLSLGVLLVSWCIAGHWRRRVKIIREEFSIREVPQVRTWYKSSNF
jgi:hypothetical protein